jgi:prepilin-type N-terminal cleavage/methylation domain-containing protein
MGSRRSAFTLIELLACVAVIAILAILASAGYACAMSSAKGAKAVSEMRQLGQAMLGYAAENDGQLPQSSHQGPKFAWTTILKRTLPSRLFHSPLDDTRRTCSYAINDFLTPQPYGSEESNFSRLQNIPAPSQTLLLGVLSRSQQNSDHFHFASEGHAAAAFSSDVWVKLVGDAGLYLFVDGHIARLSWPALQDQLADPYSRFVRPDGQN